MHVQSINLTTCISIGRDDDMSDCCFELSKCKPNLCFCRPDMSPVLVSLACGSFAGICSSTGISEFKSWIWPTFVFLVSLYSISQLWIVTVINIITLLVSSVVAWNALDSWAVCYHAHSFWGFYWDPLWSSTADAWLLALDNLVCEEIEMHHLLTIANKCW